ncbi:MAG: DNA methyltransferase [Balneola sp.]|nr:DNA methyltransferase [Balneola sp.]|tara:strand:+ start:12767 stop:14881 length:2115 start_codon:yes stop_codon:yes gene_type:complete
MPEKKQMTNEKLENQLWKSADKLRKNIDAAEYKHIVLGLIFLKYISDAFEELHEKLKKGEGEYVGADPEDKDEYKAENIFFVPPSARWSFLRSHAKQPTIGKTVDDAMDAIESENPSLKGVLPMVYAKQNLDPTSLGGLIDLISNINLGNTKARSADVLGHVFEYFLGEFALAEGKKGGQFYTPRSVVELLVEMLEPYEGRVFDPCCGSGGMFVQSEKFVQDHQGKVDDISIYGQESNLTTWRLCKMNLAIRGIDSSQVKWNNEGSFLNDAHKDLKADYIIANPPFNVSDWSGDLLRGDGRWAHGEPPTSNANFAWVQHFLYHLGPKGKASFVLADTSLSTSSKAESFIRKSIIQSNLVDCIISLPSHLFSNTQIAACIWILDRDRKEKTDQVLFIDASSHGELIDRRQKVLRNTEITKISDRYHDWKHSNNKYQDEAGICKSISLSVIKKNSFVLSPNRYVEPATQEIELDITINEEENLNTILKLDTDLDDAILNLKNSIDQNDFFDLGKIRLMQKISNEISRYAKQVFKGCINDYIIEVDDYYRNSGKVKEGWKLVEFGKIFTKRSLRVKDLGYCPKLYSMTNNGIQPREGNFSKDLSSNKDNYKIAYEGDMVFGLSREIPNLDVFKDSIGAFSGAYHVYSPNDIRLGLIIGSIMRLKIMEQTDILKGGAREGRGLDKDKLSKKPFVIPGENLLDNFWSEN